LQEVSENKQVMNRISEKMRKMDDEMKDSSKAPANEDDEKEEKSKKKKISSKRK
jgi:uncharacterized coiled-coil protein SlyX